MCPYDTDAADPPDPADADDARREREYLRMRDDRDKWRALAERYQADIARNDDRDARIAAALRALAAEIGSGV